MTSSFITWIDCERRDCVAFQKPSFEVHRLSKREWISFLIPLCSLSLLRLPVSSSFRCTWSKIWLWSLRTELGTLVGRSSHWWTEWASRLSSSFSAPSSTSSAIPFYRFDGFYPPSSTARREKAEEEEGRNLICQATASSQMRPWTLGGPPFPGICRSSGREGQWPRNRKLHI